MPGWFREKYKNELSVSFRLQLGIYRFGSRLMTKQTMINLWIVSMSWSPGPKNMTLVVYISAGCVSLCWRLSALRWIMSFQENRQQSNPPQDARISPFWWVLLLALLIWNATSFLGGVTAEVEIPYSVFLQQVSADNVVKVLIKGDE